jgi:hypothetical protein
MQSTTDPSTRNPRKPCSSRKCAAWRGSTAAKTAGSTAIQGAPVTAMLTNQINVTGPKTAPTPAVPRFCTRKSPDKIATVIGSTHGSRVGAANSRPSTALSTEIAGVMTPSP